MVKAFKRFTLLSKSMLLVSTVNIIMIFTLVKAFRLYGLYVSIMILSFANIFYLYKSTGYSMSLNAHLGRIKGLIKEGVPLMAIIVVGTTLWTIDRIMIAKMIGVTYVGYYSIAIMAKSSIYEISASASVLKPHMLEAYGSREDVNDAKKYIVVPAEINSCLLPPILGVAYFLAPFFVRIILPKFIPGILALQIILIDTYFKSLCPQARNFLIAIKKTRWVMGMIVSTIVINIVMNYMLIKMGYGIYGVAAATALSSFFLFTTTLFYSLMQFHRLRETIFFIIRMLVPLVYITGCIFLVKILLRHMPFGLRPGDLVGAVFMIFFSLPLLIYINKKRNLFSLISGMIRSKRK
jgi:O-antigen/teichoic acid export membrane protein